MENQSNQMRMGSFDVSIELLADLLHLPKSDKIVFVEYKFQPPVIRVVVEGDQNSELPIVGEGCEPERVTPMYHKDEMGKMAFEWS